MLFHGIGHRRQAWYPVLEQLAKEREVILVDLPGHGESSPLVTNGRPIGQAIREDVLEFFAQQGLDRPHVAGNSLGGGVALDIAATGHARSVTALSPAGFWSSLLGFVYPCMVFSFVVSSATLLAPLVPWLVKRAWGRHLLFNWIHIHPDRLAPEGALADYRALMRARSVVFRHIGAGAPFNAKIAPDVRITVGWAARDMVLLPHQALRARKLFPAGEHVSLPGCGHVPMIDDPKLVAEILLRGSAPV